jgi:hypothetical protein
MKLDSLSKRADDLRSLGLSASLMRSGEYSASELKLGGYSLNALQEAGYNPEEILHGISIKIKGADWTPVLMENIHLTHHGMVLVVFDYQTDGIY